MTIDLRSDTVTRPTPGMMAAMMAAVVGDDVFGDDPTVKALEEKAAAIFGLEAGLFCPSGTMTKQIAIKAWTQPGDEVICDVDSHIYNYEGGGIAFNSGASVKTIHGDRGRMKAVQVKAAINPDNIHYAATRLVVAENTSNRGGGSCYLFEDLADIGAVCREHNLRFHLDGARFFNASIATGIDPRETGRLFDSVSICLSKGLGCPIGSVLLGDGDFIRKARRLRKVLGGALRQSGYLAAAGIYALDHHVERLAEDHRRAKALEEELSRLSFVQQVFPVQTNIVIFQLAAGLKAGAFLKTLAQEGILAVDFGPDTIRMVTHLDFTDEQLAETLTRLKRI